MRILVTGASGFVGSHLVRYLTKLGYEVISVYRSEKPYRWIHDCLKKSIRVRCDITGPKEILSVVSYYQPDAVCHLAAHAIVKSSQANVPETFKINVLGTVNVLEACRRAGVESVLVMSTDKVFSREHVGKDHNYDPLEPYGLSKACADLISRFYSNFSDLKIAVVRSCNIYGYDWNPRIIPNTIQACLRGERPKIFRSYPGKRQYVYVEDVCKIIGSLIGVDGVYHIGTKDILTQEEVVLKILKYFPGIEPVYVEPPSYKEAPSQSFDPELCFPIVYTPFETGIRKTIEMFRQYREDWDKP